ncbi:ABC transporter substrate-binding protein [Caldimicrobium thiodismutans]|uniref:ABC transporter substrate-binding protein n=1 Tax=Caldimicrobium thiodismutans TaxID=1653476 RepID=A0A0U5B4N5_9BACT|nr:ABC transporter substrate-binding protein [Caldimicrobium thiodismutans]BAU23008.1 ABC transporter substrate-binding protein [Caldimicrobium thiodismutans]
MVCRTYFKILILIIFIFCLTEEGFAKTLSVTDVLGRKVTVKVPVKRAVIAITPELIPALDIWDQVAGVSDWAEKSCSVYQAFVFSGLKVRKPTVGTGSNLNIEAILKLNPDVVITWSYNTKVIEFLESKGVKVIAIWPESIGELYEVIRLHGKLFGKENQAERVIAEMEKMLNFISERAKQIQTNKRKKVLHLGGKPTTVSGRIGITNDVIKLIGGINVGAEIPSRNADVSVERIINWNPDIIFIWGSAGYDETWIYNNSQWKFIKAVRERKVYKLPHWSTWSPRLAPIVLYMAIKTYPEVFGDVNFEKMVDEFYQKVFGLSFKEVRKYEKL